VSSTVTPHPATKQGAALVKLRALGRRLDRQAAVSAGATEGELDATLLLMKQVHTGIMIAHEENASAVMGRAPQQPARRAA
jgi:hypothetical protein